MHFPIKQFSSITIWPHINPTPLFSLAHKNNPNQWWPQYGLIPMLILLVEKSNNSSIISLINWDSFCQSI